MGLVEAQKGVQMLWSMAVVELGPCRHVQNAFWDHLSDKRWVNNASYHIQFQWQTVIMSSIPTICCKLKSLVKKSARGTYRSLARLDLSGSGMNSVGEDGGGGGGKEYGSGMSSTILDMLSPVPVENMAFQHQIHQSVEAIGWRGDASQCAPSQRVALALKLAARQPRRLLLFLASTHREQQYIYLRGTRVKGVEGSWIDCEKGLGELVKDE